MFTVKCCGTAPDFPSFDSTRQSFLAELETDLFSALDLLESYARERHQTLWFNIQLDLLRFSPRKRGSNKSNSGSSKGASLNV